MGIDNLKDMTNIANIGNTLRRYKYTNLERLRGISPFSDDFYIKEKDINQITSVKVIAMFGFTGNNPLQDANLNDEKVLSQIFTFKSDCKR